MKTDYAFHESTSVRLKADAERAFSFLDDPHKLSSHMGKSSWMMAGSKMEMRLDDRQGRTAGAEIVLEGKMMGVPLSIREFVTERTVPRKKVWQTEGPQKMIVIEGYRMGFEIEPLGSESSLKVFIDYDLPRRGAGRLLGRLFGAAYARWCTKKMAEDASRHFAGVQ